MLEKGRGSSRKISWGDAAISRTAKPQSCRFLKETNHAALTDDVKATQDTFQYPIVFSLTMATNPCLGMPGISSPQKSSNSSLTMVSDGMPGLHSTTPSGKDNGI
jgi:hypothetical protein